MGQQPEKHPVSHGKNDEISDPDRRAKISKVPSANVALPSVLHRLKKSEEN